MDERTDPNDERPKETPIPADAPIESPQADPRTEGAPDSGEPKPVDPSDPAATEEQIREAFE